MCVYSYCDVIFAVICMPALSTLMGGPLLVRRRSVAVGRKHKATSGRQWRVFIWNQTRLPYST